MKSSVASWPSSMTFSNEVESSALFVPGGILLVAALLLASASIAWFHPAFLLFRRSIHGKKTQSPSIEANDGSFEKPVEVSKELEFGAVINIDEEDDRDATALFELERRAIFGTVYHRLAHISRLPQAGSYITLPKNNCLPPLFVIRDRQLVPRIFHNVCRHRAYTVTRKEAGTALVLGCRYHGWCYDTKGRLVKAPQFEDVQGFKKEENGLWEAKCAVDVEGWIWGCVDGREESKGDFGDSVLDVQVTGMDRDAKWVKGWDFVVECGWKSIEPEDLRLELQDPKQRLLSALWPHRLHGSKQQPSASTNIPAKTGVSSFLQRLPGTPLWIHTLLLPNSASKTALRFDLYTSGLPLQGSRFTEESLLARLTTRLEDIVQKLEVKYTELRAQGGNTLLPAMNSELVKLVKKQVREERVAGREILPWVPEGIRSDICTRAEKICEELDSLTQSSSRKVVGSGSIGGLDW